MKNRKDLLTGILSMYSDNKPLIIDVRTKHLSTNIVHKNNFHGGNTTVNVETKTVMISFKGFELNESYIQKGKQFDFQFNVNHYCLNNREWCSEDWMSTMIGKGEFESIYDVIGIRKYLVENYALFQKDDWLVYVR